MKPRSKFGNVITEVDGLSFDSRKEAARWVQLVALQRAGKISGLRRQVPFPIKVNGVVVTRYRADFVYCEAGRRVVEDAKGMRTPMYRLKKKMLAAMGIEINEV